MACSYQLTLGKTHFKYAPSSWKACITPTQAQTLFGHVNKPKAEACGVFACVYPHSDPSKIVKITRDPSDVAGLVRTQEAAIGPKVFQAHKLGSYAAWTKAQAPRPHWQTWPDKPQGFALVLERLRPLTGAEKRTWGQRLAKFLHARREAHIPNAPSAAVTTPARAARPAPKSIAERVCPREGPEVNSCRARIQELEILIDTLADWGVDWIDIHAGNIGVDSRGRWRVLDMGASHTPLYDKDAPVLAGAKRARRRRR